MPKVEKISQGEDPDPSQWLFVSLEQKRIDQSKPYDAKKACWVPDEKEGYVLGEIKSTKGDLVSVSVPGGEVKCHNSLTSKEKALPKLNVRWKCFRLGLKSFQSVRRISHLIPTFKLNKLFN